ncbi:SufS family cysteine desulfurase [Pelagibacteraceae bacterium]|nr:SufS family cysteine desulfurase [Pelagibacteraceae bacterium]
MSNPNSLRGNNIFCVKEEFPILNKEIDGKKITYLDSAASAQKPKCVIEVIKQTYENNYANVHRGIYKLSQIATEKYEEARSKVAKFINANSTEEIIFTRGATEGINLIASCLANKIINADDEIMISTLEHHSNIIPWQIVAKKTGAKIIEVKPDQDGNIFIEDIKKLISNKTKLIALPHVTNSIGSILAIEEICEEAKKFGIITVIDGCQAIPHISVNVKKINADFYVFSGHKLYGPSGIGVLYGRKDMLNNLDPYQTGGEMIDYVSIQESTYTNLPNKFEAGTPNIVGAIGLGKAIDFVSEIGMDTIKDHSKNMTNYLFEEFKKIDFIRIIGNPKDRLSIVSFLVKGSHPHDVALLLDNRGIAIRAGHHCAQPAMRHFKVETTLRASVGIYNNYDEIDFFISNLKQITKYF